jgi:EmrB/QacA subfamily drug resistance transporter
VHRHLSPPSAVQPWSVAERRPWRTLVLLAVAQFMVVVDMTVVNVALPSIGAGLRFSTATDLQWVVTMYVLFSGGLQLLGGRAADLLGRRRTFLLGLSVFTAASLSSGMAPNPLWLIVSRAAQGLGAALLSPAVLSVVTTLYAGSQRAAALGAWGAIGGAGAAAGLLLGGLLTTWLGWPWVFFINVPVGVAALLLTPRLVPALPHRAERGGGLDLAGALAAVGLPVLVVFAVTSAPTRGWASPQVLIPLLAAAGLGFGFAHLERQVPRPLIPPAVWRVRSLVSGTAMMLGATGVLAGILFLTSIYLQRALGASPLEAGLIFLPFALAVALAAHLGGHLLAHLGTRLTVVAGLLIAAGGLALMAGLPVRTASAGAVLPGLVVLGLGLGLAFLGTSVAAMADVGEHTAGLASGLMTTGHEIGAALGVAVLSGVATASAGGSGLGTTFAAAYRAGSIAAAAPPSSWPWSPCSPCPRSGPAAAG